jgi:hypothetical protein
VREHISRQGPYKIVLDDDLTVLVLAKAFEQSKEHVNITICTAK